MRTLATNRSLYMGFARQYDGIQSFDSLGTLGNLGSNLGSGLYIDFDIQTTETNFGEFGVYAGGPTIGIEFNRQGTATGVNGYLGIFSGQGSTSTDVWLYTSSATNFNDGQKHHIVMTIDPVGATGTISIDGVQQAISYQNQHANSSFSNFLNDICLGGIGNGSGGANNKFACTLDNFQIGTSAGNLYGSYTFDKKTLADSSGNGNDATAGGSPTALYVQGLSPVQRQILAVNRTLAVGRSLHP